MNVTFVRWLQSLTTRKQKTKTKTYSTIQSRIKLLHSSFFHLWLIFSRCTITTNFQTQTHIYIIYTANLTLTQWQYTQYVLLQVSSAVIINTAVHFLSLSKNRLWPSTVIIFTTVWPWTPALRCTFTQWQDTSTLIYVVISVHFLYLFSLDMWLYFRTTWPQTGSCYHPQPLQAHSEPQLQLEKKKREKKCEICCVDMNECCTSHLHQLIMLLYVIQHTCPKADTQLLVLACRAQVCHHEWPHAAEVTRVMLTVPGRVKPFTSHHRPCLSNMQLLFAGCITISDCRRPRGWWLIGQ